MRKMDQIDEQYLDYILDDNIDIYNLYNDTNHILAPPPIDIPIFVGSSTPSVPTPFTPTPSNFTKIVSVLYLIQLCITMYTKL